ncbi:MAG: hypothetical protein QXG58_07520 [Candidatus Bathyarchaeia archaeon]
MFGFYKNFPVHVHEVKRLTSTASRKRLQQAIIQALHRLNNEGLSLETIANPSIPECMVIFEFGIAESETFNYLNQEEVQKALEIIGEAPLEVMDFFCAVRYYKQRGDKNKPLKFDYYMLRLAFNVNILEVQVFHERGPRHISPEDLINLIVNRVNDLFPRKVLRAI